LEDILEKAFLIIAEPQFGQILSLLTGYKPLRKLDPVRDPTLGKTGPCFGSNIYLATSLRFVMAKECWFSKLSTEN
jgi:hypothetical protein